MSTPYAIVPQALTQAAVEWLLTLGGAKECEPYQTTDIERLNQVEDELAQQVRQWIKDRQHMTDTQKDFKETYLPGDIIEVHERSHTDTRQDNWSYPSGGTYTVIKAFNPVELYQQWQEVKPRHEAVLKAQIKGNNNPTEECVFWMYLYKELGVATRLDKPQLLNITDVIKAAKDNNQ